MSDDDSLNHSFIIKLWVEECGTKTKPTLWRGHVTHIPSGDREYIQELNQIVSIIRNRLDEVDTFDGSGSCEDLG